MSTSMRKLMDSLDVEWITPKDEVETYVPTLYHALIKVINPIEKKVGSIVLVQDTKNREALGSEKGVILAIGDCLCAGYQTKLIPKVGDTVLFQKYSGQLPNMDDPSLRLMNDTDIVLIVKSKKED